jgi:acetylornithine/succinyldiaminopimelate/putrescine aminotransferase
MAGTLNSAQTIRIEPPIVVTYDEIDAGLSILEEAVSEVFLSLSPETKSKKKKFLGIF